jgi:hypothetical protein
MTRRILVTFALLTLLESVAQVQSTQFCQTPVTIEQGDTYGGKLTEFIRGFPQTFLQ